jgi:hypothetical protein
MNLLRLRKVLNQQVRLTFRGIVKQVFRLTFNLLRKSFAKKED